MNSVRCFCDIFKECCSFFWEALASEKAGVKSQLLMEYSDELDVGHHTAYKTAVLFILGKMSEDEAMAILDKENDDLNYVVAAYGIASHLNTMGKIYLSEKLINDILNKESVWPCVSYLAAFNDC